MRLLLWAAWHTRFTGKVSLRRAAAVNCLDGSPLRVRAARGYYLSPISFTFP